MIKTPVYSVIENQDLRKIIQDIVSDINSEVFIYSDMSLRFFTTLKAETSLKVPHRLGFTPTDLIVTNSIGAGAVTFHYDKFDETNLVISTTGAVTLRFLIGRLS